MRVCILIILTLFLIITTITVHVNAADQPPLVIGTTSGFDSSAGTSRSITLPSGSGSPSYILLWIVIATGTAEVAPTGWNVILNTTTGGSGFRTVALARAVDGTEGLSITLGTVVSTKAAWTGYRVSNAVAIAVATRNTGSSASPQPPNMVMSIADWYLFIAAVSIDSGSVCIGFPPKYSNALSAGTSSTNITRVCSTQFTSFVGNDQPGAYTLSVSAGWAAETFAFIPQVVTSSNIDAVSIVALVIVMVAWGLALATKHPVFLIGAGIGGIFVSLAVWPSLGVLSLVPLIVSVIVMLIGVSEVAE